MKRLPIFFACLAINGFQFIANSQVLTVIPTPNPDYVELSPIGISPNGRYIIANWLQTSAWSYNYNSKDFIIDLQTWQETEAYYKNEYRYGYFSDINNFGNACGTVLNDDNNLGLGYGTPAIKDGNYYAKGNIYVLGEPDSGGIYFSQGMVSAYGINDNKTIVGTIKKSSNYEPILWTSEYNINLPIPTDVVNDITEYAIVPLAISNDEQTIIGYASHNRAIPLIWSYTNGTYECTPLASTYIHPKLEKTDNQGYNTPYVSFSIEDVSNNLEWISGNLKDKEGNYHVARYDVKNDCFDILENGNLHITSAGPITNDGTMIPSGSEDAYSTAFYWSAGSKTALNIKKVFPILSDYNNISIAGISSDGLTIFGCSNQLFVLSGAQTTELSQPIIEEKETEDCFYNLNGIKVSNAKLPGIYIHNGKKVIIR